MEATFVAVYNSLTHRAFRTAKSILTQPDLAKNQDLRRMVSDAFHVVAVSAGLTPISIKSLISSQPLTDVVSPLDQHVLHWVLESGGHVIVFVFALLFFQEEQCLLIREVLVLKSFHPSLSIEPFKIDNPS